jgi:hypothetical protein|tara:strand:- start:116 stop:796 length:681 start_codon:yes stop_codon:yes gene_type:complete
MARISSYPRDLDVNDKDAWIGTESSNRLTRNFTAEAVAKYLNIKGKISISAQMVFKFDIANQVPGTFNGPADGATFASITTMELSTIDASGQNVVAFMDYIVGNDILISEQKDISTFGHYTIDSYTPNGNFYTLALTNKKGEGALVQDTFYDFAVFTLSTQGVPTFIFNQGVPATTWSITHNLGKFPSITVIDTGNTVVTGEYTYVDNNNVILTFSAGFAGKAYLN